MPGLLAIYSGGVEEGNMGGGTMTDEISVKIQESNSRECSI